jgi:5-methylthioadenosine/S-adenosylhomocysteine deaminase
VTTRLEADAVFTVDDDDTLHRPGAVEIDRGVVTWVGDPSERPAASGVRVERFGGVVMPGLVNCHAHSPMTLVRSAGDGLPLERWLSESIWPREARMSDDDAYWGMVLGAAEMLANGVTTSCEQYRHPEPVTDALLDSGMRAVFTTAVIDLPGNPWQTFLAEACRVFDERNGREGRLHVGFGPHAAYTVPPDGLSATAEEARRRDALLQIHLSETEAEDVLVQERYGARATRLLADLGVLEARVLAAHAVWLDDADVELLGRHDVAVAHCPGSNGKLGAGVARLRALLDRGVRVGLGTDGPASNDDLHLWDEMRLAALLARAVSADPGTVSSVEALRLATRGGGEALGLGVGVLERGRPADIIRLRTDDPRFSPALDDVELLGHLVWAGAGYLVTDVWVAGERVVEGGRCTRIDAEQARDEVTRRAGRLRGP